MQKFTRPLTREIEVGGERLAVTLGEEGISVRPVGSRKPSHALSWPAVVCACAGVKPSGPEPTAQEVASALAALRTGSATPSGAAAGQESGGLKETLARLDRWLKEHRKGYHDALKPGAKPADLKKLAEVIGPLPDELRTWLEWHNGQDEEVPGALRESFYLLSAEEIAAEYQERMQAGHWKKGWIPLLADGQGDLVVLDTLQETHPVREVWRGRGEPEVVADNLEAWVEEFVQDVENGLYHEDPERGDFIREGEE